MVSGFLFKHMDCKQAESLIPAYLENSLEPDELLEFLKHIDECSECREELSIQFLITDGLNSLNTGDSYDLQSAMEEKVSHSRKEIERHDRLFRMRNLLVTIVIAAFVIAGITIYMHLV